MVWRETVQLGKQEWRKTRKMREVNEQQILNSKKAIDMLSAAQKQQQQQQFTKASNTWREAMTADTWLLTENQTPEEGKKIRLFFLQTLLIDN